MTIPVLYQFKSSHYSEKVRWALDFKNISHRRYSYYGGWHVVRNLLITGQTQVPILKINNSTLIESTHIVTYLEQKYPEFPLFPNNFADRCRALKLVDFCDEIGIHLRRVHYSLLLPHFNDSTIFFTKDTDGVLFQIYKLTFPFTRSMIIRRLDITPNAVQLSRKAVESAFQQFEKELQSSGYLVGNQFSIADLTAAALVSTFIVPPEFPYPLSEAFPDAVIEYRDSLEKYDIFPWARGIYTKHRPSSAEVPAH